MSNVFNKSEKQQLRDAIAEQIAEKQSEGHYMKSIVDHGFADSDFGLFVESELNFLQARAYETKYPEYKAKEVFAKDEEINPHGKSEFSYKTYAEVGEAAVGDLKGEVPTVTIDGTLVTGRITNVKQAYEYDLEELRAAAENQTNLSEWNMRACMKGIERTINRLTWLGDAKLGIKGFLDASANGIPVENATLDFGTASGSDIVDFLIEQYGNVFENFQEDATEMWLPPKTYKLLDKKLDTPSNITAKEFILQNTAISKIGFIPELAGAGAGGKDRIMLLNHSSERKNDLIYSEAMFQDTQAKDLGFKVPAYAKFGGVKVPYPQAHLFVDVPVPTAKA